MRRMFNASRSRRIATFISAKEKNRWLRSRAPVPKARLRPRHTALSDLDGHLDLRVRHRALTDGASMAHSRGLRGRAGKIAVP